MRTTIEVADSEEAKLIRQGLQDPRTRALVKVMGALLPLPRRAQSRTLQYIADYFALDLGDRE